MLSTMRPPDTQSSTQADSTRPALGPKQRLAKLSHKGCVVLNLLHGNDRDKGEADEQVNSGNDENAGSESDGQIAPRVADVAGDPCPPPTIRRSRRMR